VCATPSKFEYGLQDDDEGEAPVTPRRASKAMIIGRVIGWFFVAVAIVLLARDAFAWANSGTLALTATGELWFALHQDSLLLAEPAITRHVPFIGPWLWHPVISTFLTWPAFLFFAVLGLILSAAFRRRRVSARKSK